MATIIIIRHAEKHRWPGGTEPTIEILENYIDDHLLSVKGMERAHALVGYFTQREEITQLYKHRKLACLVAQDQDLETGFGKSERPRMTLEPLFEQLRAEQLRIPLECFAKRNLEDLAEYLKGPTFIGKTVIVCWSHQMIPQLASLIGASNVPKKWPKGRYDLTWIIDTATGNLQQVSQRLVFGDCV